MEGHSGRAELSVVSTVEECPYKAQFHCSYTHSSKNCISATIVVMKLFAFNDTLNRDYQLDIVITKSGYHD